MTWLDILMGLLCQIYQQYGGDCDELLPTPKDAAGQVLAAISPISPVPPDVTDLKAQLADMQLYPEYQTVLSGADRVAINNLVVGLPS